MNDDDRMVKSAWTPEVRRRSTRDDARRGVRPHARTTSTAGARRRETPNCGVALARTVAVDDDDDG